jgi:DNA mismatch repair ATPase MutS
MNINAQEFYQHGFDTYSKKITLLSNQIKRYSRIRIVWFLLGIVSVYFASTSTWFWISLLVFILLVVFIVIAVQHGRLIDKKKEASVFFKIYSDELNALNSDFSSFDAGKEFADPQHPFASDLDLFGKESVFQMLNRNFSKAGKISLSAVLKDLEKEGNTIRARQKAVDELSKTPKWLTHFRALGVLAFSKDGSFSPDPNKLAETLPVWIKRQSIFKNSLFKYVQYILPTLSLIVFVLYLLALVSSSVFILYLIVSLAFTGFYAKQINQQHQELSKQSDTLFRFQKLINHIEKADFESEGLQKIQRDFYCEAETASRALKNLAKITQAFDTRLNIFAWLILNYFLLWDIRQSIRLERWKSTYNQLPNKVFKAIAEVEMLAAFATFNYNRTDLIFPEIIDDEFVIEGKEVGHPLMPEKARIDNGVSFPSAGQFYVITGANMAGKSTYLRTVGVNLILALSGAPVCAKEFKTSVLQPFTSIKTTDSLSNNESYFYAELLRLQRIIEALKTGESYFIILDEILKGTNSKDKEQGSKALVKQLIGLNAAGIIATHDLQLAELSNSFPENVKTACFEVEIKNEQLVFDYKLRAGVSQNLNATFLMKKMGIS